AFSIGKWKKYTVVDDVALQINVSGECEIQAYHCVGTADRKSLFSGRIQTPEEVDQFITCETRVIDVKIKKNEKGYEVSFLEQPDEGIIFVSIKAKEECKLSGGYYFTVKEPTQVPYLGLGICTFKREDFLRRNVNSVLEEIDKEDSVLHNKVEVFISDNGQSVEPSMFEHDKVHLYPNKNAGGAGGFTRTIIEAVYENPKNNISHMILMDDDIELYTEVLKRTYLFLSYMKEEHKGAMVGGEMFPLDKRYRQFEAGAEWRGPDLWFYNKSWNMKTREAVAANEEENPIDYSGWWYSVIPVPVIKSQGLPIPMFIHYDDVEYGTRNKKNGTILLNGICVWHPQGINKAPVRMTYYDLRNVLIGMAPKERRYPVKSVITNLRNRAIGAVMRYRYLDVEVCFEAFEDFCKGPRYFMDLEPVKKHEELAKFNNVYVSLEDAGVELKDLHNKRVGNIKSKFLFLWGLLLWLLPSVRKIRVVGSEDIGLPFSAKRLFYYDETKNMGYVTEKSYTRAWKDVCRYFKVTSMLRKNYDKIMDEWEAMKPEYTGIDFWKEYLELGEE
ncbi:MAG: glycosyltransferase, partial [Lachnospiraceae bacterium]|nr:glycosyltransferase [Lachnospiraceae bacterium]